jgi:predicted N-formylglutamate amidohydrolase
MTIPRHIPGNADILILCDHASNAVPTGIDLGIDPAVLAKHVAIDLGAAAVSEAMAARLDAPAILATVSRLVIDLNREPDSVGLIPLVSDGHAIPGNEATDRAERIARFHAPYHAAIAAAIRASHPRLLLSIHSFTQKLERHDGRARPWEIGVLYNRDARAARIAIDLLNQTGVVTGDNEPYSGRLLNTTMNRHAEANGIPYLGFEIRNDLIADTAGVAHWSDICSQIVSRVRDHLAQRAVAGS